MSEPTQTSAASPWPTASGLFELGDLPLQSGGVLRNARLQWKTHGKLSAAHDNVIVYPTSFGAQHPDVEWLIGPDGVLDPTRWFIVAIDMFGNGLSSSPSNHDDYPALVSTGDNVRAQQRMLSELFAVERLACVYGWSMGAQQAYHWAALFPDRVDRVVVNCGSARTAPHNQVFIDGLMAVLRAAPEHLGNGRFSSNPEPALRAFGRVYAGWALSQRFYRDGVPMKALGAANLQDYLGGTWEPRFVRRQAANLYAHLTTWYHSDISSDPRYGGDLTAALRAIRARVLLMPGATDLYFRVADNEAELPYLRDAELRPIPSVWGHLAGNPQMNPADAAFIRDAVRGWLD
ncbi:MAG: alpha/beta fold hydrolase [Burkholderiaceae bacterium]